MLILWLIMLTTVPVFSISLSGVHPVALKHLRRVVQCSCKKTDTACKSNENIDRVNKNANFILILKLKISFNIL